MGIVNAALGSIQTAIYGELPQLSQFLGTSFLLALAIQIGLCRLIFEASLVAALKATIVYAILVVLAFLVVSTLAVSFSFNEFILGALR